MRKTLPTLILLSLLLLAAPAQAELETWKIDTAHTSANFKVKHLLIATVRGQFTGITGTVKLDPEDLGKLEVDVTIDATTVDTGNEQRDRHLKTADFFDIKKHPTITFVSKKVEKKGDELKVSGDLTLNGVTRPVVLEVEDISEPVLNPAKWYSRAATASTVINRQDYGVSWNKTMDTGGAVVGDEVKIEIDIELNRKPEPKS
ncbi:MAG: YceI family protein [Deltaproteobacteria bacterium]|nr:YceI family protein [Deltaproteobacteria bacterium]